MLVWDFPAIAQGVGSLAKSRLSPVYNEVAPVFAVFGRLFGRALEAQVGKLGESIPIDTFHDREGILLCIVIRVMGGGQPVKITAVPCQQRGGASLCSLRLPLQKGA
jgi:hypothetical protein